MSNRESYLGPRRSAISQISVNGRARFEGTARAPEQDEQSTDNIMPVIHGPSSW
jgi:hypothetical protein